MNMDWVGVAGIIVLAVAGVAEAANRAPMGELMLETFALAPVDTRGQDPFETGDAHSGEWALAPTAGPAMGRAPFVPEPTEFDRQFGFGDPDRGRSATFGY